MIVESGGAGQGNGEHGFRGMLANPEKQELEEKVTPMRVEPEGRCVDPLPHDEQLMRRIVRLNC